MEKRQITRQELVAAALKLGARPGTIRQWFHRAIPYRWQIRLMEYFEGPVEISDWAPEATVAIAKPSIAETWRKKHLDLPRRRLPAGAGALPPTFVFEDLRGVLLDHVLRADLMLTGLAINSLLFAATAVGFARLLASARRAGTLLQMGE
jgi:hypothetical protein